MDDANRYLLDESGAKVKLLFDANVLSYAEEAYRATGCHLLGYMESIHGTIDWFVANDVAMNLYNNKILPGILTNILNSGSIGMKMDHFPYVKADGSVGFVKLNKLASDDWGQIVLAYNYEDLIIVTNDSKMFKSAHAVLNGRAIAFHDFLENVSPYWDGDENWSKLKGWLIENKKPLRNNSSWILPPDAKRHLI